MKIRKNDGTRIEVRNNDSYRIISAFVFLLGIAMIVLLCSLIPDGPLSTSDMAEIVFVSAFICVILYIGVSSFIEASKVLILDQRGVLCRSIIKKVFLDWSDVNDYGLSYWGQTRFEGDTFYLYFSNVILDTKKNQQKKTDGAAIKLWVLNGDYDEVVNIIIRYSKEHTDVVPFISERNHHRG